MRLSSHDASFLYTETASGPMHGTAISVLDGPATFEEVFEFIKARVHLIPRFRQKLALVPFNLAHPVWVDDPDFDIENHLKPYPVPPGTTMDKAIEIALELGEPLLDRNRPLWLFYVLENIEGKTLLVQMSHHAFVDGATLVAMSTVLTTMEPDAEPPAAPEPWNPGPVPSGFQLWQEAMREQSQSVMSSFRRGLPSGELVSKATALMTRMNRPVMQAPWNATLVGPKRKLATLQYTLDDIREIRKTLGGTVNDVVLTVVTEGVARYMAAKGEQTENQNLRLMCPVNVRSADSDPLDMDGNKVSGMFPVLSASPKKIEDRYLEVRAEMQGIKERGEAETLQELQELQPPVPPVAMGATLGVGTPLDPTLVAARIPQPVFSNIGFRPQQAGFNFTVTNVPGPTWAQYMAGYEVVETFGTLMLGGNLGFGVAVGSFNGKVFFNLTADPRLMPDIEKVRDMIADVFEELSALGKPGNPTEEGDQIAA